MLSKTKKLIVAAVAPIVSLVSPMVALAGRVQIVPSAYSSTTNIIAVIRGVIRFILIVAFIIAFIMLIIGGIRWILAGGDEKKVEGARGTITAALIGLVIVLLAFAIIRVVEAFFGVTIISGETCIPLIAGGVDCTPGSPGGTFTPD